MPGSIVGFRTGDEDLPYIDVTLGQKLDGPHLPLWAGKALVDTGASHCTISSTLAEAINLTATGRQLGINAVGSTGIGGSVWLEIGFIPTSGKGLTISLEAAVVRPPCEALILGWHALKYFNLSFGEQRQFSLSWRQ
ncbi:retroviral-like aspartic protease family protein [Ensifer adhaerens]